MKTEYITIIFLWIGNLSPSTQQSTIKQQANYANNICRFTNDYSQEKICPHFDKTEYTGDTT